jgi:NAD+ synthase
MSIEQKSIKIIEWLKKYCDNSKMDGFVVGVSGGVDSALTSTLCALTNKKVIVVGLPILQPKDQISRSKKHMDWLCENYKNVSQTTIDLTDVFNKFKEATPFSSDLALANTRSRIRMIGLYSIANTNNLLVAGTGNKVEDYGIGFFTKYGDGGVDLSPIADLLKSEVREMCRYLKVLPELSEAIPTDGLWNDNRSDEDQIGATYDELEWALKYYDKYGNIEQGLSEREKNVLKIYVSRHLGNKHKLQTPEICYLGD